MWGSSVIDVLWLAFAVFVAESILLARVLNRRSASVRDARTYLIVVAAGLYLLMVVALYVAVPSTSVLADADFASLYQAGVSEPLIHRVAEVNSVARRSADARQWFVTLSLLMFGGPLVHFAERYLPRLARTAPQPSPVP